MCIFLFIWDGSKNPGFSMPQPIIIVVIKGGLDFSLPSNLWDCGVSLRNEDVVVVFFWPGVISSIKTNFNMPVVI